MDLSVIRERILATPLVKGLPENMRQRFVMMLLWVADTRHVMREEQIFKLGEKDSGTGCMVLEGMVRIKTERDAKKTIGSPDILGEVQLFTPQGTRTATVEVVVGGEVLMFQWRDLGAAAHQFYTEEELATLKKTILDSAWKRDASVFEKIPK